jgi:hypothetical protein
MTTSSKNIVKQLQSYVYEELLKQYKMSADFRIELSFQLRTYL